MHRCRIIRGVHCKIVDFENNTITSKETFNKKWGVSSPKDAEVVTMFDMLEHAKGQKQKKIEGEIILINDNKLLNNDTNEKWGPKENT